MEWLLFAGAMVALLVGAVVAGRILVRKEHEARHELRDPTAGFPELERGTVMVLHGPAGCGKTQLGLALMALHGGGQRVQPADLHPRALAGIFAGKHVPVLMVDEIYKWTPSIVEALKQLAAAPAISYDTGGGRAPVVSTPLLIACAYEPPPLAMITGPLRRFRFHRADYRPPVERAAADDRDTQRRCVRH